LCPETADTHRRGSAYGHPGQPTAYKAEYSELGHNYCLLGATNEELGSFFGVDAPHRGELARWKEVYSKSVTPVFETSRRSDKAS
jgi:hypothetical protein